MKKYIVIGLIVLVGGALLIGPLLNGDSEEIDPTPSTDGTISLPAKFDFRENLAAICETPQTIKILVKEQGIQKLEVNYDGTVIQSWNKPTGNVSFDFTGTTVGTYSFDLVATMKGGKQIVDERSLRVVSDIQPQRLKASIVDTHPHLETSFTQGLEFENGVLFEGVGLHGESKVMRVNLETGEPIRSLGLDGNYFGEGITLLNEKLYQLTWQRGKCFVYNYQPEGFELVEEKTYIGEGWGLCNNGTELIMSDGSENLYFRDPYSFQEIRRIQVFNDSGPIRQLNELEFMEGKIYANVYQTNLIISIDPESGKVLEMINCDELALQGRGSGMELNGIAQNDNNGKIYVTGKNWPLLFEVNFIPAAIQ